MIADLLKNGVPRSHRRTATASCHQDRGSRVFGGHMIPLCHFEPKPYCSLTLLPSSVVIRFSTNLIKSILILLGIALPEDSQGKRCRTECVDGIMNSNALWQPGRIATLPVSLWSGTFLYSFDVRHPIAGPGIFRPPSRYAGRLRVKWPRITGCLSKYIPLRY